ncbi:MAG: hypothetical protein AAGD38_18130 [Acidobacteriota bacterium]
MPVITIVYGLILTLLGIGTYFGLGKPSVTALIPTFLGVPLIFCGGLARNEKFMKHAMHLAAVISLLGFLGTLRVVPLLFTWIGGGEVERPAATVSQAVVLVLSLVFLILCVRSFIAARKAREAGA